MTLRGNNSKHYIAATRVKTLEASEWISTTSNNQITN